MIISKNKNNLNILESERKEFEASMSTSKNKNIISK